MISDGKHSLGVTVAELGVWIANFSSPVKVTSSVHGTCTVRLKASDDSKIMSSEMNT